MRRYFRGVNRNWGHIQGLHWICWLCAQLQIFETTYYLLAPVLNRVTTMKNNKKYFPVGDMVFLNVNEYWPFCFTKKFPGTKDLKRSSLYSKKKSTFYFCSYSRPDKNPQMILLSGIFRVIPGPSQKKFNWGERVLILSTNKRVWSLGAVSQTGDLKCNAFYSLSIVWIALHAAKMWHRLCLNGIRSSRHYIFVCRYGTRLVANVYQFDRFSIFVQVSDSENFHCLLSITKFGPSR